MKIEWHGGPSGARPCFFSVWNGKSYDRTDVRDPGTTVTIDANVPLSQTTIYLLVNNTASGSTILTDAVIVTPEK